MDGFRMLEQLIQFSSMRHGVLASNIANVDTPNYKAKDMNFKQTFDAEMKLMTTKPEHIKTVSTGMSNEIKTETSTIWADGNNVELGMEVAKITENAMLFQAGISMLSTKIRMFKNALRR